MKRQSSTRATRNTPARTQPSLTSYFQPKQTKATEAALPSRAASQSRIDGASSSSEDELASLDSLLKTRQSSRTSGATIPTKRDEASDNLSPPSKVPITSGAFNIKALLADRSARIEQKATIERLEAKQSRDDVNHTGHDTSAGLVSERVRQLLQRDKQEAMDFWVSVHAVEAEDVPACPPLLSSRLPDFLLDEVGRPVVIQELCYWLEMTNTDLSGVHSEYLTALLIESTHHVDVEAIVKLFENSCLPIMDALSLAEQSTGLYSLQVIDPSVIGQAECCSQDLPPTADSIQLAKMEASLGLLTRSIESSSQGDLTMEVLCRIVRLATLLHLDHAYGHILGATLMALHCMLAKRTTDASLTAAVVSLVTVARGASYQFQIIESLPVSGLESIERTQILASMFFLNLEAGELSKVQTAQARLESIITFIQSEAPFYPLDNNTAYEQIKDKIALLSQATTQIDASQGFLLQQLIENLQSVHGRIVDSKAAFITRSEAKAAIQRLSDRLKYTLAAQGRKHSVFEHFT